MVIKARRRTYVCMHEKNYTSSSHFMQIPDLGRLLAVSPFFRLMVAVGFG